jgi:hypothetical protein
VTTRIPSAVSQWVEPPAGVTGITLRRWIVVVSPEGVYSLAASGIAAASFVPDGAGGFALDTTTTLGSGRLTERSGTVYLY